MINYLVLIRNNVTSVLMAELWGLYTGIKMAWEQGWQRVIFSLDSKTAVTLVQNGCNELHPCRPIIKAIQWFLAKDWMVRIEHCYREANRVADCLANFAHDLSRSEEKERVFSSPLTGCMEELQDDLMGVGLPRWCRP